MDLRTLIHSTYLVNLATFFTSIFTFMTVLVIAWQAWVARRSLEFQSYLGIEGISEGSSLGKGIPLPLTVYADYQSYLQTRDPKMYTKIARTLSLSPNSQRKDLQEEEIYDTVYQKFCERESPETRDAVYEAVSFLSTISHLVTEGYLDKYQAWSRYFFTYRLFFHRLLPWYIHGMRKERHQGEKIAYATFERMCELVHEADQLKRVKKRLMKRQTKGLHLSFVERLPI